MVGLAQLGSKPSGGRLGSGIACAGCAISHLPTLDKAEGVPYLVVEVASLLAEALVEENVVAGRSGEHHAHAYAVGAEFLDKLDGIGAVAQLLRHLASLLVANNAGEVDVAEGHLADKLLTGHDHASHPEEDDVGSRHKVGSGVVIVNLVVAGMVDAVEERDGPEPAGEPCVQRILVLTEVGGLQVGVS